jgi:hypothetical protein
MNASFYATICGVVLLGLTGNAVGAEVHGPAPSGQTRAQTRADQPPQGHRSSVMGIVR